MVRNQSFKSRFRFLCLLSLLVCSCSKGYMDMEPSWQWNADYKVSASQDPYQCIGTVRSREEVRYIQLDAVSAGAVVNPEVLVEIPDGTRVFAQYRLVQTSGYPAFCDGAILVDWASPVDVGEIRYDMQALEGDPVSLVLDWITSLEDGFLTLHYTVLSSGTVNHSFSLYPSVDPYAFRLVHDAHGDQGRSQTDGIICFPVGDLLPQDTGDGSVTLSLTYLNLEHIQKTLTIEYRSPK